MSELGDRVVVRYLLPDGRATDVIGILVSAADPLVVDADTGRTAGERHTIAHASLVAMRTVPPKPARRLR